MNIVTSKSILRNALRWAAKFKSILRIFMGIVLLSVTFAFIVCCKPSLIMDKSESVKNVKILCWVLTSPSEYYKKAVHVKTTWGKRCDQFLLMSSANDTNPDAIALPNTEEGYDFLWGKTREAFKYIWKHHRNDADWFLKADDDTFVILENLRLMLYAYNPSDPLYFGAKFKYKNNKTRGYMAGGPGYILSRESVRRLVEQALPDAEKCKNGTEGDEDDEIGQCLENVGVVGVDTRDNLGRYRFLEFDPNTHVNMRGGYYPKTYDSDWYWGRIYYPQKEGAECCSSRAISFHYLSADEIHTLEYLIYQLRPFGILN